MLYFIVTTTACNLRCLYCGNDPKLIDEPIKPTYPIRKLRRFLSYDKNVIICFYGGEPLVNMDFIYEVMDEIDADRWILQTNGLLLDKLDIKYLRMFDTILVSIDGREKVTDYYRGRGVYRRVLANAKLIRDRGFKGDLVARMTVSGLSDIYLEITHLLSLKVFNHIHWQLDALWDLPPATRYSGIRGFKLWLSRKYNPGVSKLVKLWIKEMEVNGKVLGIAPFQGLAKIIFKGLKYTPPCEAGSNSLAISTSGRVYACPITQGDRRFLVGDLDGNPNLMVNKITISNPCLSCDIFRYCGGRCLYANKTMLWGRDGFNLVCDSVRHLVHEILRYKGVLEHLIRRRIIDEQELFYPSYNNSVEIIP